MALNRKDVLFIDNGFPYIGDVFPYVFPYIKPSDQAKYDKEALWIQKSFSHLVHPYSNSLSGTLLCQLRALLHCKLQKTASGQEPLWRISIHMSNLSLS